MWTELRADMDRSRGPMWMEIVPRCEPERWLDVDRIVARIMARWGRKWWLNVERVGGSMSTRIIAPERWHDVGRAVS